MLSLGHAPLNLWFLSFAAIFLSILGIAKQRDKYKIALFTFFLGMGYFILTLNWIVEPFLIDFISHAWIAPFAIFFISIVMSLFWYIFSFIFASLGARWALLLGVATAEYFRSFFLTGFPWYDRILVCELSFRSATGDFRSFWFRGFCFYSRDVFSLFN